MFFFSKCVFLKNVCTKNIQLEHSPHYVGSKKKNLEQKRRDYKYHCQLLNN